MTDRLCFTLTIAEDVLRVLEVQDGQTSAQIIHEMRKTRPALTGTTLHPVISRMGRNHKLFCHQGRWYIWPLCARVSA